MKFSEKYNLDYEIVNDADGVYVRILGTTSDAVNLLIPSKIDNIPVKIVAPSAFKSLDNLESVAFEEGVQEIGNQAFRHCTKLKTVTFPSSLKIIYAAAFDGCCCLENVTVFEGLKKIGYNAFSGCSISNFNFPDSLSSIGTSAFHSSNLRSATFGKGLTHIYEYAFQDCYVLESVTFQEGLQFIDREAFSNCMALQNIAIPDSVTEIGYGIVDNCGSLKSIHIGEKTYIHEADYDFAYGCDSLEKITVSPKNKTYTVLNGVLYDSYLKQLIKVPSCLNSPKITIPAWVTDISYSSLCNLKHIRAIKFTREHLKGIGDSGINVNDELVVYCPKNSNIYDFVKNTDFKINTNSKIDDFLNSCIDNQNVLK